MKLLKANISEELYSEIEERVRLGLYSNKSEVVNKALKKTFAGQSRGFLRDLVKNKGITQQEMLTEWEKIRK